MSLFAGNSLKRAADKGVSGDPPNWPRDEQEAPPQADPQPKRPPASPACQRLYEHGRGLTAASTIWVSASTPPRKTPDAPSGLATEPEGRA